MNKLLYKIGKLNFYWIVVVLIVLILLFALFYYFGISAGNGISYAYSSEGNKISFMDCVYFSIVTFTTLGFGDFYPNGNSRIVVIIEVILGLTFFGLLVSRFTAAKSEYILHRLYTGDVERRFHRFDDGLNKYREEISTIYNNYLLNNDYCEITNRILSDKYKNVYEDLLSVVIGLRKYIGFEVYYGEVFIDISRRSIYRVLDTSKNLIVSLFEVHSDSRVDMIISNVNKKRIEKIMKGFYYMSEIIGKYSIDYKTKLRCSEIQKLTEKYYNSILNKTIDTNK